MVNPLIARISGAVALHYRQGQEQNATRHRTLPHVALNADENTIYQDSLNTQYKVLSVLYRSEKTGQEQELSFQEFLKRNHPKIIIPQNPQN